MRRDGDQDTERTALHDHRAGAIGVAVCSSDRVHGPSVPFPVPVAGAAAPMGRVISIVPGGTTGLPRPPHHATSRQVRWMVSGWTGWPAAWRPFCFGLMDTRVGLKAPRGSSIGALGLCGAIDRISLEPAKDLWAGHSAIGRHWCEQDSSSRIPPGQENLEPPHVATEFH